MLLLRGGGLPYGCPGQPTCERKAWSPHVNSLATPTAVWPWAGGHASMRWLTARAHVPWAPQERLNSAMSNLMTDIDRDVSQIARAAHEAVKKLPVRMTCGECSCSG
jgi:hypothetical protein